MSKLAINLDMGKLLELVQNLPAIATQLGAQGIMVPEALLKYVPAIGAIGGMASKFVSVGGNDQNNLLPNGIAEIGPAGRGKMNYLRSKDNYSDADVSEAFYHVLDAAREPALQRIKDTVDFALSITEPGVSLDGSIMPSPKQTRRAVDMVLGGSALSEALSDQLGDSLSFALRTIGRKKRERERY